MESYFSKPGYSGSSSIVRTLIFLNVGCWLADILIADFTGYQVSDSLALYNWNSDLFRPWQLFSYMFMHGDLWHVAFNMFALWMFGSVLEKYWGAKRFLLYYLITGIGAGIINLTAMTWQLYPMHESAQIYLSHPGYEAFENFVSQYMPGSYQNDQINKFLQNWYYNQDNPEFQKESIRGILEITEMRLNTPCVGASGSIYGLLLAFGVLFPNAVIMMLIPPIPIKAKYFVLIFGAIELFSGIKNNIDDNVAHFAHLGGMVFGIVLLMLWKKKESGNQTWEYE